MVHVSVRRWLAKWMCWFVMCLHFSFFFLFSFILSFFCGYVVFFVFFIYRCWLFMPILMYFVSACLLYTYIYVWNQGNKYGLNTTQVKISLLKKTGEIKLGGRKKITFSKSTVEQPSRSGQKKVFYFLTFRCNSSFTKKLSTRAESFLTLKPHTKIYFW